MLDAYEHLIDAGQPGGPLVFALHGTGGDETQFSGLVRSLWPNATVVAPRGDVSEHGAARFFRRTGDGIYDMADLDRATAKMAGFVAAHAARVKTSEVVGLGYSNGANMLAAVSFRHPGLFSALVLLHPLIPFQPTPQPGLSGVSVLMTAGRRDPICPPAQTERLAEWYRAQGARTDLHWHPGGHEIAASEISALTGFARVSHERTKA